MEARNAIMPAELLTALPSIVNLPENETRLGSSGARGDNAKEMAHALREHARE